MADHESKTAAFRALKASIGLTAEDLAPLLPGDRGRLGYLTPSDVISAMAWAAPGNLKPGSY